MRARLTLLALLTPLLLACQLQSRTVKEEVEETLPLAADGRLEIENVNGDVELTSWERDEVRVEAMKTASAFSAKRAADALAELDLDITRSDGYLKIEADRPRRSNWLFGGVFDTSIHFRITAPASARIDLQTVNGKLEVIGARGRLDARSINGRIALRRIDGPTEARTVNGSIRAELEAFGPDHALRLSATNGGINVSLPGDGRADLDARTTNGSIRSSLAVDGSRGRRHLRGKINGGGGRLDLQTTNGSIRVNAR